MPGTWVDTATGAPPVFPIIDEAAFDSIATEAVGVGAHKGQELLKGGIDRGRSQWPRLKNWTMLIRIAKNRPSNSANYDTGDFYKSIVLQLGGPKEAMVGLMTPQGPKGQDMMAIARVMEGGATIRITEKMRGWFASMGLNFRPSTTHIYIPPRPVFGTATPEMDEVTDKLVEPFRDKMEALFT